MKHDTYELGFATVRDDLQKQSLSVPIVANYYYGGSKVLRTRWVNDTERFEVMYYGKYREAESIDFDHITRAEARKIRKGKNFHA
jgi:hypothetical protein